jgi:ABC-type multidrug transport system ATPase subunit
VLKGVDLTVEKGTILALLGPNGAGKTTTIRILSTLLRDFEGSAAVTGHDVTNEPGKSGRASGSPGNMPQWTNISPDERTSR